MILRLMLSRHRIDMDRKTEDILSRVKRLKQNSEEIKSLQFIGGVSFQNYTTNSGNSSDFNITVPNNDWRTRRINFNFSNSDEVHIVSVSAFFRLDNSSVMTSPTSPVASGQDVKTLPELAQVGKQTWLLNVINFSGSSHTYYFKFYFKGTTPGTFNITTP